MWLVCIICGGDSFLPFKIFIMHIDNNVASKIKKKTRSSELLKILDYNLFDFLNREGTGRDCCVEGKYELTTTKPREEAIEKLQTMLKALCSSKLEVVIEDFKADSSYSTYPRVSFRSKDYKPNGHFDSGMNFCFFSIKFHKLLQECGIGYISSYSSGTMAGLIKAYNNYKSKKDTDSTPLSINGIMSNFLVKCIKPSLLVNDKNKIIIIEYFVTYLIPNLYLLAHDLCFGGSKIALAVGKMQSCDEVLSHFNFHKVAYYQNPNYRYAARAVYLCNPICADKNNAVKNNANLFKALAAAAATEHVSYQKKIDSALSIF
jgi:hypothetical protein